MTAPIDTVLYTAQTRVTGGRDGAARSSDGKLDVRLSPPGSAAPGTNPEQLFAAGWSACFIGAIGLAAKAQGVTLPPGVAVDAEVDLAKAGEAYLLRARLNVSLPGLDKGVSQSLVEAAHETCPYSKATRGNIDVTLTVA
ncbi:organic hydroperoxide resistance protein [Caulobacter sp.]|uniref:organic hydroperoxide resistance protein n=1 Tax=Caulobacter sp. TaxID=78 RepID=UPI0025C18795|nr:organic hydroperoxide resistance protein [Caulobacter sp.]